MNNAQWSDALDIYQKAQESLPDERLFRKNATYLAQEWLKTEDPRVDSTRELIDDLYIRLGDEKKMSSLVSNYYLARIKQLNDSGAFEQAVEVSQIGAMAIRREQEALKVRRYAWDDWAGRFAKKKQWQEAIDIYQVGLEALPGDSRLTNNAVATWHSWAETFMKQKDWDGAIEIYTRGLERMPETRLFKQNIKYCEQEREG